MMAATALPVGVEVSIPSRKAQQDSALTEFGAGAGDFGDGSAEPVNRLTTRLTLKI